MAMPPLVFHYTSNAGLIGIVRSRGVWASDIRYLNDMKDYAYAFEIFEEVFRRLLARPPKGSRSFLAYAKEQVAAIQGWQTFVVSFSEVGDLLSQWRAYCPPGQGVSIGFDTAWLQAQAATHSFEFSPCIYRVNMQCRIARTLILEFTNRAVADAGDGQLVAIELAVRLHELAPRLKHPAFAEEREWRLISAPRVIAHAGLKFREGRNFVVPYREISLAVNDDDFQVPSVIIGPTPHPLLAEKSVAAFLQSERIVPRVYRSAAPYRAW